jgi:hypothetical protein
MNVTDLFHTPNLPAAAAAPRRRWSMRTLIVCGALLLAAGAGITFTLLRLSSGRAVVEVSREQAQAEARRALSAFLAASTPEQRAEMVIGGDRMLPLMQAYYAGRELDTVAAADFQPASWSFSKDSPDMVALELPRGRALSTVVACMKKTDGRWLMDWDIWTQTMGGRFREFLIRPAEGEHTLRVRLTSSAVSPDEVKLDVADPFNTGSTLTLETTRPDLTALYLADLPAGTTRTATVQLVWLNDSLTGTLQAVLRRHVCWGFQGLDGVEAAEREPARARKHHPPMPAPADKNLAVNSATGTVVEIAVESAVDSTALSGAPAPSPPAVSRTKTASRSTAGTSGR